MKYLIFALLALSTISYASDRFVVITDSHGVGEFGEALSDWLRARPNTPFELFASGGSAPLQWTNNAFTTPCGLSENSLDPAPPRVCSKIHTPSLASLWLEQPIPVIAERKITVIVQGTNFDPNPLHKKEQVRYTKKLMKQATENSDICLWVGPPNMRRSPGYDKDGVEYKVSVIRAAIEEIQKENDAKTKLAQDELNDQAPLKPEKIEPVIGKNCIFIDSRDFSTYPVKGDGIHYQWPGGKDPEALKRAREWGQGVAEHVDAELLK